MSKFTEELKNLSGVNTDTQTLEILREGVLELTNDPLSVPREWQRRFAKLIQNAYTLVGILEENNPELAFNVAKLATKCRKSDVKLVNAKSSTAIFEKEGTN